MALGKITSLKRYGTIKDMVLMTVVETPYVSEDRPGDLVTERCSLAQLEEGMRGAGLEDHVLNHGYIGLTCEVTIGGVTLENKE